MTTQENLSMVSRVNVVESTVTSRLRDFVRMNPPIFLFSKVREYPQMFQDRVYKVLSAMAVASSDKEELVSYKLREVAQVWYTQWKDNRPVDSGPIEWEEFKEAFLGIYDPYLVYNLRDEMIRFVTGVAHLVREECRTRMLHDDMTLSIIMVSKKRAQTQEETRSAKLKLEKGSGSQNVKPTCVNFGKRHYGKCRRDTRSCFGFGKEGQKVTNFPIISSRGREGNQVAPNVPMEDVPKAKACFHALQCAHKVRYCPNVRIQDKGSAQAQASGSDEEPKMNHFNVLRSRGEQETSLDVVTNMLLTNPLAAFMNLMNRVFQNYLDLVVFAFIDNILVYSKNESYHTGHLSVVLRTLKEHQLFAKYCKCELLLRTVAFVRHIISREGV
nr:uncharacterized protein LOC109120286 [Solanum lycopersicum]